MDSLPPSQKVAISGDPGHSNGEAAPEPRYAARPFFKKVLLDPN